MKYHRYHLQYALSGYQVVDTEGLVKVVYQSDSKSETIAKCQELNGYKVDGDERTYAEQIREFGEGHR